MPVGEYVEEEEETVVMERRELRSFFHGSKKEMIDCELVWSSAFLN